MLLLLSPAKKLDYDSPLHVETHTQPLFVDQAAGLIKVLKTKTAEDISDLMSLSPALSELNVQRYAHWKRSFTQANARQAVLAFNGDVYEGLDAATLSAKQLDWAQEHVAILSGLYGVLRPLDLMQPYRLEMGTRLESPKGKNLYEYWGSTIADYLNERQAGQKSRGVGGGELLEDERETRRMEGHQCGEANGRLDRQRRAQRCRARQLAQAVEAREVPARPRVAVGQSVDEAGQVLGGVREADHADAVDYRQRRRTRRVRRGRGDGRRHVGSIRRRPERSGRHLDLRRDGPRRRPRR